MLRILCNPMKNSIVNVILTSQGVGSSTTSISTEGRRSCTLTGTVRSTRPPAHARTTIDVNVILSTGHVFTFFDHSVMQSRQKMCSQVWGVPTSWSLKRNKQMEHLSELPSELSDAKPELGLGASVAGLASEWSVAQPDESLSASESRSLGRRLRRVTTELPELSLASASLSTCKTRASLTPLYTYWSPQHTSGADNHPQSLPTCRWSDDAPVAVRLGGRRQHHHLLDPAARGARRRPLAALAHTVR